MFYYGMTLLCNRDMLRCFLPLIFPKRRFKKVSYLLSAFRIYRPFFLCIKLLVFSLKLLNRYILKKLFCLFKFKLPNVSQCTYVYISRKERVFRCLGSGMKAMTAPRQQARPRRKLPRQKYIFPFSKHKEV